MVHKRREQKQKDANESMEGHKIKRRKAANVIYKERKC